LHYGINPLLILLKMSSRRLPYYLILFVATVIWIYLFFFRDYLPGTAIHIDVKWASYGMLSALGIFWYGFFNLLESWPRFLIWIFLMVVYFYRKPLKKIPECGFDMIGLVVLVPGLLCYLIGDQASMVKIGMIGLILTTYGLLWVLLGRWIFKYFFIPLVFFLMAYNHIWMEWIGLSIWLKEKALQIAGGILHVYDQRVLVRSLEITIEGQGQPAVSLTGTWLTQSNTSWIPLLLAPFLATAFLFWRRVKMSWIIVYTLFVPLEGFITQMLRIICLTLGALYFGEGFINFMKPYQVFLGVMLSISVELCQILIFWWVWIKGGRPTDTGKEENV